MHVHNFKQNRNVHSNVTFNKIKAKLCILWTMEQIYCGGGGELWYEHDGKHSKIIFQVTINTRSIVICILLTKNIIIDTKTVTSNITSWLTILVVHVRTRHVMTRHARTRHVRTRHIKTRRISTCISVCFITTTMLVD